MLSNRILNIHENGGPLAWSVAEQYLQFGSSAYKTVSFQGRNVKIIKINVDHHALLPLILKIVSYATIILPLIALCVAKGYRNTYKVIKTKPVPDQPPKENDLKWKIETEWLEQFERALLEKRAKIPVLETIMLHTPEMADAFDTKKAVFSLRESLQNLESYQNSQETVLQTLAVALHHLTHSPQSSDSIEFAKQTYKLLAEFLRKFANPSFLKTYQKFLAENEFFDSLMASPTKPASLLTIEPKHAQTHASIMFLLTHVRKQVKLLTKMKKIEEKTHSDPEIQTLDPALVQKAMPLLFLTWIHGTKAFTLLSAHQRSHDMLLPLGQLRTTQTPVICGELKQGADPLGVNQTHLSGVNLHHADVSTQYSTYCQFDETQEIKDYEQALKPRNYSRYNDCVFSDLPNLVEHVRKLRFSRPDIIQKDAERINQKIKEIKEAIYKHIFVARPQEIFAWHDDYWTSYLYVTLKSVHVLETLLSTPVSPSNICSNEEKSLAAVGVIAASTTIYGRPIPLDLYRLPYEEVYGGGLQFGRDLTVLFAQKDHMDTVTDVIKKCGYEGRVKLEELDVLLIAQMITQQLGSYLFDAFNVKKWERTCAKL